MTPWQAFRYLRKRQRRRDEFAVVARGAGRSIVVQVVGLGLGYAVHVLLARWMGTSGYGVYTYVLAWAALLSIPASGGLPILVVRYVPEYRVREAWGLLRGVLTWSGGQAVSVGIGLALVVTGLLVVYGEEVAGVYARPLLIGVWIAPLQALVNLASGIWQGFHRIGRSHSLPALRHVLILAFGFALWWKGRALTSPEALGATMAALLGVLALQGIPLRRVLPELVRRAKPVYTPRTWLRVAVPLLLVSGFILILNQADLLMVGSLLGPREAGLYRAASKTASLVGVVFTAAVAAAGPMMARLYTEGAHARLQRLASAVAHWIFWPSLVLVLVLTIAAAPVLSLFGPDFPEARWVLVALVLGQLANAAAGIGATVLNLTGYHDWGAAVFGWSALLNVALNAAGILLLGLVGAAAATALTLAVQSIVFCLLARRKLHLDPSIVYALRHPDRSRA